MADHDVPRRTFLAAVAGAAVGTSPPDRPGLPERLRRFVAEGGPDGQGVNLGVASYSLRNFPRGKAIAMAQALGARYINLKYDTDADVEKYFAYAKAAGLPLITAHAAAPTLPRIERFAKQYDIKVAIHNHGPEDKNFPSPYDALKHVKNMDRRMGLCIDIGHTVRTGTDVVQAVADAGPRLLDMHAKDLRDLTAKGSQCIVGEGAIPIAQIFQQLQAIGFRGYVNLEYEIDADDPLPGMKQSFAYMRGALAGLSAAGRARPHS